MKKFRIINITFALVFLCAYGVSSFLFQNVIYSFVAGLFCVEIITLALFSEEQKNIFKDKDTVYEFIHDIKTPVTAQNRITELFLKNYFGYLTEEQRETMVELNNSQKFVMDMLNNLCVMCAYEHNNLNYDYEIFDINELIKHCIFDLKYISAEKRCSLLFDYADEQLFVYASKIQITRVITNLLANAVNYSYKDRVITVITKSENNKCIFGVRSYGDIIDKDNIENIFTKYKSLQKTGNGLGLYICKIILEKHNSKILIESDKRTGNYFGFELKTNHKIHVHSIKK